MRLTVILLSRNREGGNEEEEAAAVEEEMGIRRETKREMVQQITSNGAGGIFIVRKSC